MNSDRLETRDKREQAGIVKLSARLLTVAGFVRQGSRIADVGTDHGYIPVYLAQTGRISSAPVSYTHLLSFDVNDEKGEIGIIKDISFTVGDGKFVVITGPNGGGKSTTAKLIMGIERPTGGRILFDGQDITDMSITDRANLGISFAFQQPVRFKGCLLYTS